MLVAPPQLELRGYTSVNAENLGDFREFFGRKVLD